MRHSWPTRPYITNAGAFPPLVASVLQPAELETIRARLAQIPEPPAHVRLRRNDWQGAPGVFLLVFLSTFPVVVPFLFMSSARTTLRVSSVIAVGLLFLTGCAFGRIAHRGPWGTGIAMVMLGGLLVSLTMALGG